MSDTKAYVFSGDFESLEEAYQYSQSQWEPEPDQTASNEEYEKWEDSNPTLKLEQNINSYLDEDFIETVDLRYEYLDSLNMLAADIDKIKNKSSAHNVFVLVFEDALGGFALKTEPKSTDQLTYCGVFRCVL